MKRLIAGITVLAAALPVLAQPSDSWRMPYERDFWGTGHIGAQIGQTRSEFACPTGGCEDNTTAVKLFGGGKFNNTFGGEISYFRTQDFDRPAAAGGDISVYALNFGLLAGIPLGANSSVFGKLGLMYGHTEVGSGSSGNGWGPSYGLGAQIGVTRGWALRADWDRYRFKLPAGGGDRENVDAFMIGAQYTFGNPPRR